MLFRTPAQAAAAHQADCDKYKKKVETQTGVTLADDFLTTAGIWLLCAKEFAAYDAAPTPATATKLHNSLISAATQVEYLYFDSLQDKLNQVREMSPLFHSVAIATLTPSTSAAKNGATLAKMAYKALFAGDGALELTAPEAQDFLMFVADLLVASKSGILTSPAPLLRATDAELADLGDFLNQAAGALNTHDAKSYHSAAKMQGAFFPEPTPSRFLSGESFPVLLSGRAGGGPLRAVSWLENLFSMSISLQGRNFTVLALLCDSSLRAYIKDLGITAFDAVPVVEPALGGFDSTRAGSTQVKLSEKQSVTLSLIPSNAMLCAMADLGRRVGQLGKERIGGLYRSAVFAQLPEAVHAEFEAVFPLESFIEAAGFMAGSTTLLKKLNKELKQRKLKLLAEDFFDQVWNSPERRAIRSRVTQIPIVGSNSQNCGGAYATYAGANGPYRFPAARWAEGQHRTQVERMFYTLDARFKAALARVLDSNKEAPSLEDKYQVGTQWLPRRTQAARRDGHVTKSVIDFMDQLVNTLGKTRFAMEALDYAGTGLHPIQQFALNGGGTPEPVLVELARDGLALLRTADAAVQSTFVAEVVRRLQKWTAR